MIIDYSIENQAFLPTITLELLLLESIFLMESNAEINLLHLLMLSLVLLIYIYQKFKAHSLDLALTFVDMVNLQLF